MENRLKKGLGRGLSSLLGDVSKKIETNKVSIKDIVRNKFQPRKQFNKESLEELKNKELFSQLLLDRINHRKENMKLLLEKEDGWLLKMQVYMKFLLLF